MKPSTLKPLLFVAGSLLLQPLVAQPIVPDIAPALQTITDRQAERAQQQAAERAQQQVEAAQQRVAEQAAQQQAEVVQEQVLDRVATQVERVQTQAAAQQADAVQTQVQERVAAQVERVQSQAAGQQAEAVQGQVLERVQSQVERAQGQASERAQEQIAGQAQQRLEQVQQRVEQVQQVLPRGEAPGLQPGQGPRVPLLPAATGGVVAQVGAAAAAAAGDAAPRTEVPVNDRNGNQVFVELTLPDGARSIAFEWIMLVTPEQRARLDGEAAALMSFLSAERAFGLTDGDLLTFRVPPDLDADDAILELVPADLRGQIDRNHLFSPRDYKTPRWLRALTGGDKRGTPLPLPMRAVCEEPLKIGMVDAQVDLRHSAFARLAGAGTRVVSQSFVEADLEQPSEHGTAVASLWLGELSSGRRDDALRPLLPEATVYSATVFHLGADVQEGASAVRVLAALDWMAQQDDLHVINMSLAGPPNRLLAQAIDALYARNRYVVAAVGNDGPHGPARYPAAYANVIAVAAADRAGDIFRWSNQGEHVDYAALGVDVPSAGAGNTLAPQSGTSLAAPVVAAFLACGLEAGADLATVQTALEARLLDQGAPGHDPVFGRGLLHTW